MCVIVVAMKKKDLPTVEVFTKCARTNRDGMGFMYVKDNWVHVHKGFDTPENMHAAIQDEVPKTSPVIAHFRIGTSGDKIPGNTHPFPITQSIKRLQETQLKCYSAMVHNGILSDFVRKNGLSDTQNFTAEILAPIAGRLHDRGVQTVIGHLIGSDKLVVLLNTGTFYYWGKFIQKDNAWFSNTSWDWAGFTVIKSKYDVEDDYPYWKDPHDMMLCPRCGAYKLIPWKKKANGMNKQGWCWECLGWAPSYWGGLERQQISEETELMLTYDKQDAKYDKALQEADKEQPPLDLQGVDEL